jgi:hypothetical protein
MTPQTMLRAARLAPTRTTIAGAAVTRIRMKFLVIKLLGKGGYFRLSREAEEF